jgi:hypothetical protein
MPKQLMLNVTRGFARDQAVLGAYTQRRLGLRTVPVAAITGTVGRADLSDPYRLRQWSQTQRYRALRAAMEEGLCPPPVDLCLLAGHYYIRDGHHRVAISREMGIIDIDAEVTEYLPEPRAPAAAWHRARVTFERDTGLTGLHVRRADGYELLRRQIAEHGWYLGEQGRAPRTFSAAAAAWEADIYRPVETELVLRRVLDRVPEWTTAELYLAVCDHKWYRSERLARDIGFTDAMLELAVARGPAWRRWLARRLPAGTPGRLGRLLGWTLSLPAALA